MEITNDTLIGDILNEYPEAMDIFEQFGLSCAACSSSQRDTLQNACDMHDVDPEVLLYVLNN